ncbi:hypothetical protein LUZ60_003644 [Juncus effusus]|nr:hypothetical protein LUZ60_003644 [Juncus effusus]
MNLSRLLSFISKQTRRNRLPPTIPFSSDAKQNLRKKTKKDSSNKDDLPISDLKIADPMIATGLKRPTEIPFQPRVANKVELIGKIGLPVERQELQGGIASVSVLVQEKYPKLPQFWIPIIFQGELAEIASTHLKQNETVHIVGQLSGDMPLVKINECQANVQVLAHSLSYVRDDGAEIDVSFMEEKPSPVPFKEDKSKNMSTSINPSWEDLVANPQDWCDNRMDKQNGLKKPRYPDFSNKATKAGLWLNVAPEWIFERINDLKFDNSSKSPIQGTAFNASQTFGNCTKVNAGSKENLWKDLLENTEDWWDNRTTKKNPKGPDFSKKITREGLWLNEAPHWVEEKLSELNFNKSSSFNANTAQNFSKNSAFNANTAQSFRSKEDLWKDLVESPDAWYDNRFNKKNPKQPDFKHKDSGEALWISETTPEWARSKFPSMKSKNGKSYSFVATDDSDVPSKSHHTTLLS